MRLAGIGHNQKPKRQRSLNSKFQTPETEKKSKLHRVKIKESIGFFKTTWTFPSNEKVKFRIKARCCFNTLMPALSVRNVLISSYKVLKQTNSYIKVHGRKHKKKKPHRKNNQP